MTFQLVQLIGEPPEALKEVLRQELNQEALVQSMEVSSLAEAQEILPLVLPDLVVFFADSLGEQVIQFCQEVRAQITEHRPIIVISSQNAAKDKRIEYFLCGADDYLSTETEPEEFAVRLLVHLRRNVELLSNSQTRLPGLSLFSRLIQRKINVEMPWALLMIELNNFSVYNEVYGRLPSEQILKTLASLLKSLILPPDIVGQADNETFLIMTSPEKAERIAEALCMHFDEVVPNFYSEKDQKRGYIISVVNEQISQRVPFVCLSIGVVSSENKLFKNHMMVFNQAVELKNIAKGMYGSNWSSEKARLAGDITHEKDRIKRILVLESDAALAFLLKSTLEMQGYQVDTCISDDEARSILTHDTIDLLLMDPVIDGADRAGWELCQWVRQEPTLKELTIIAMSTLHDREKVLSAGQICTCPSRLS